MLTHFSVLTGQPIHLYLIEHHPYVFVLALLGLSNAAGAMPSPESPKAPQGWWYAPLFAVTHILTNIPRIIMTLLPQFAWLLGPANKAAAANGNGAAAEPSDRTPPSTQGLNPTNGGKP